MRSIGISLVLRVSDSWEAYHVQWTCRAALPDRGFLSTALRDFRLFWSPSIPLHSRKQSSVFATDVRKAEGEVMRLWRNSSRRRLEAMIVGVERSASEFVFSSAAGGRQWFKALTRWRARLARAESYALCTKAPPPICTSPLVTATRQGSFCRNSALMFNNMHYIQYKQYTYIRLSQKLSPFSRYHIF